jgi:nicotinamidase-related amidase
MWTRPDPDRLEPTTTALLVFDMLEAYRPEIEKSGALETAVELVDACRERGVIVCFARADHRPDGADFTRVIADTDRNFRPWSSDHPQPTKPGEIVPGGYRSLAEFHQGPGDFDIPKHRWNAFHGTALDVVLRAQNIDSLLVIGGSTHVGVASTVYAARDLDYQVIVVRDGCTGDEELRTVFLDRVFPRMVRVRTAAEVLPMLDGSKGA